MVLIEIDTVMMLATGVPAAARMLAVFADAAATIRDLAAEVAALLEARRHTANCRARPV
eukprot:CAMPEP_0180654390 /NCGR_PEP_ID=MMETSP1037_2-20121125/54653_1 /TAXON_ID=632150 /ORGANISM="Azadinium spinosum, Strain 3D9" /LENGTH=58 /DNA_ID=CAMNT_0022680623 /DNA_START=349 /DNA_END=525 /DNA_ORIENTATION=+